MPRRGACSGESVCREWQTLFLWGNEGQGVAQLMLESQKSHSFPGVSLAARVPLPLCPRHPHCSLKKGGEGRGETGRDGGHEG